MKALLYTLVLGSILIGGMILMQRYSVRRPAPATHEPRMNREPIASAAPVDMSHLGRDALQAHSMSELYDTGVEFFEQWHVPEARAVFEHIVRKDSTAAQAYLLLAECDADPLLFNGSFVARDLENARRAGGDTLRIAAMRQLYLEGNYAGAAAKLERVVHSRDDDLDARCMLALAHFKNGELRRAQVDIEAILERDESHGRARALLVECLLGRGEDLQAERLAKDLASLYPGEPYPYALLARVQFCLGRTGDAIEFCNNALNLDQRYVPAILTRADLYVDAGEYEAARVTFEKLLLFDEPMVAATARESIARIDFLTGRFDGAVDEMDEAIRLAQGAGAGLRAAATLYRLVNYLCELGQGDEARAVLARWDQTAGVVPVRFGRIRLEIFDGDLSATSAVLAEIGMSDEIRRMMKLLGIDYNELMALTRIKERKYDEAIRLLANEEDPDTSYYFLGFAAFESGYAEQASSHFRRVLAHRPGTAWFRHEDPVRRIQSLFYLAEISLASGRTAEARAYYRRFIDRWGDASWELQAVARARDKLQTIAAPAE